MSTSDQEEGERNRTIGAQDENGALVGQRDTLIVWKGANISCEKWVCGDLLGESRHNTPERLKRRLLEQGNLIRHGVGGHLLYLVP